MSLNFLLPSDPYLFIYQASFFSVPIEIGLSWYVFFCSIGVATVYSLGYSYALTNAEKRLRQAWDFFSITLFICVFLGARFGYAFFYQWDYYWAHPMKILEVWEGGMSFHGGVIGAILGIFITEKRSKIEFMTLSDALCFVVPAGLFWGRIGNFCMGELYGRIASRSLPWVVHFPQGGPFFRHPSQLYEAFFEGLLLFTLLIGLKKQGFFMKQGKTTFTFLISYGTFRFFLEFFREKDWQTEFWYGLTRGQLLCLGQVGLTIALVAGIGKMTRAKLSR